MSLDQTLSALADPNRREILSRLSGGELRMTDLAAPFEISLNGVSKHVKILESAGLVSRRKAGREHFLSANPAPIHQAADWFDAQRAFWGHRLDALEAALMADDEKGSDDD